VLQRQGIGVAAEKRAEIIRPSGCAEVVTEQTARIERLESTVAIRHCVSRMTGHVVLAGEIAEVIHTPEDRARRAGIVQRLIGVRDRAVGVDVPVRRRNVRGRRLGK